MDKDDAKGPGPPFIRQPYDWISTDTGIGRCNWPMVVWTELYNPSRCRWFLYLDRDGSFGTETNLITEEEAREVAGDHLMDPRGLSREITPEQRAEYHARYLDMMNATD